MLWIGESYAAGKQCKKRRCRKSLATKLQEYQEGPARTKRTGQTCGRTRRPTPPPFNTRSCHAGEPGTAPGGSQTRQIYTYGGTGRGTPASPSARRPRTPRGRWCTPPSRRSPSPSPSKGTYPSASPTEGKPATTLLPPASRLHLLQGSGYSRSSRPHSGYGH